MNLTDPSAPLPVQGCRCDRPIRGVDQDLGELCVRCGRELNPGPPPMLERTPARRDGRQGRRTADVLGWLREHGRGTSRDIAEHPDDVKAVNTVLHTLAGQGVVVRVGQEPVRGARPRTIYALPEELSDAA